MANKYEFSSRSRQENRDRLAEVNREILHNFELMNKWMNVQSSAWSEHIVDSAAEAYKNTLFRKERFP